MTPTWANAHVHTLTYVRPTASYVCVKCDDDDVQFENVHLKQTHMPSHVEELTDTNMSTCVMHMRDSGGQMNIFFSVLAPNDSN